MDVEQRACTKRGQTEKTDRNPDRLVVRERKQNQGGRVIAQRRNQAISNIARQGLPAAHGIAGVGIEYRDDAIGIALIAKIRFANKQVH